MPRRCGLTTSHSRLSLTIRVSCGPTPKIGTRENAGGREDRSRIGCAQRAEGKPVMKVGLFINTQFPEGFNVAECIPEMVAQVRAARDAGFASLWLPHHWLTPPMQMLQITPLMGYLAAHAEGLTIGPNILILPPLN